MIKKVYGCIFVIFLLSVINFSACTPPKMALTPVTATNTKSGSQEAYKPLNSSEQSSESTPLAEEAVLPPLRFTFPEPGPLPISLWRPPLCSVPWALSPFDHFYFVRPIAADEVNWPLADYRYGGIFPKTTVVHTGIDIDAPLNTPVLASASGKVVWAGYGFFRGEEDPGDPYGMAVSIRHDFGYQGKRLYTVYAHMNRIDVVEGQRVEAGTRLGIVGETGRVTGPHLHFEVRMESNNFYASRNPELWLAPPQGWGVLVGRVMNTNGSLLSKNPMIVDAVDLDQQWEVITYGQLSVNSDDFYDENLVLSDLPAGNYFIKIVYEKEKYSTHITINPGAVSYFTFWGKAGFDLSQPPLPSEKSWLKYTN